MVPERHMRHRKRRISSDSDGGDKDGADDKNNDNDGVTRKDGNSPESCTICLHYNSMLYMDFLGPGQMAVVEQPWLKVISHFPEPLQRRVYGVN